MSDSLRFMATRMGVTRRTVQRWCAAGKVPGARRTKGGHWRFDGDPRDVIAQLIEQKPPHFHHFTPHVERRQLPTGDFITVEGEKWEAIEEAQRCYDATELAVTAQDISDDDLHSPMVELEQRDPKKAQWLRRPLLAKLTPRSFDAVEQVDPTRHVNGLLISKAYRLRLNLRDVTPKSLASELKISVATLYRRYGREAVRNACRALPECDESPASVRYQLG